MEKKIDYSGLFTPLQLEEMDDAIVKFASRLQTRLGSFTVDDLLGFDEFDDSELESVTSDGAFLKIEDLTVDEIEALIAERVEVMAKNNRFTQSRDCKPLLCDLTHRSIRGLAVIRRPSSFCIHLVRMSCHSLRTPDRPSASHRDIPFSSVRACMSFGLG